MPGVGRFIIGPMTRRLGQVLADVDAQLADGTDPAETSVQAWSGCEAGSAVELWTIPMGGHAPDLAPGFADALITFLAEHPKP